MTGDSKTKLRVVQNLGWLDRLVRLLIGAAMIAIPYYLIKYQDATAVWINFVLILSIYPCLTAFLGWDPLYALFRVRSCGNSPKNPCGTLPFEVDAALGNNPVPEEGVEHSLSTAHHEGRGQRN